MKIKVLVLAPNFPAINQPWIDTYLEQLLQKGIKPIILTCNKSPGKYSEKVDRLSLRNYVADFDFYASLSIGPFLSAIVTRPLFFIRSFVRAVCGVRYLVKKYSLPCLPIFVKSLFFGISGGQLTQVDLIHSHDEVLAFEFMLFAFMWNKPLVYTFHGLTPKGVPVLAGNKRRALYGEVETVLVNTEFSRNQVQQIGCPAEKIIVLPQGLPLEDFPFVPRTAPEKNEPLILLTVGRYHEDKGQRYALLALRRLRDMGINAQWKFVGVGPDMGKLIAFAKKLGVSDVTDFYTNINLYELRSLYQSCHFFVLPSLSSLHKDVHVETQGVVLQEAQASGCIPIATMTGGIPECLHDKEDAILVEDRSARSIADAVVYLLDHPEEWSSYQKNGRRNVEQNFSADVIGQRMAEILTNISQGKRSEHCA